MRVVVVLVRQVIMSSQYNVLVFIVVVRRLFVFWVIQTSKICIIRNNKSNQWLSIGSTINFESIYYAINLGVVSSFMVFSDFDFIFLSMYCEFKLMKLFLS